MKSVIQCCANVGNAIDYLYTFGLVHCDLKPSNIGVSVNSRIKIFDLEQGV